MSQRVVVDRAELDRMVQKRTDLDRYEAADT
jgi:hypothetical protein